MDEITTVTFKKAIARKVMIIGGVVVGIVIAGALLTKVTAVDTVVLDEAAE